MRKWFAPSTRRGPPRIQELMDLGIAIPCEREIRVHRANGSWIWARKAGHFQAPHPAREQTLPAGNRALAVGGGGGSAPTSRFFENSLRHRPHHQLGKLGCPAENRCLGVVRARQIESANVETLPVPPINLLATRAFAARVFSTRPKPGTSRPATGVAMAYRAGAGNPATWNVVPVPPDHAVSSEGQVPFLISEGGSRRRGGVEDDGRAGNSNGQSSTPLQIVAASA